MVLNGVGVGVGPVGIHIGFANPLSNRVSPQPVIPNRVILNHVILRSVATKDPFELNGIRSAARDDKNIQALRTPVTVHTPLSEIPVRSRVFQLWSEHHPWWRKLPGHHVSDPMGGDGFGKMPTGAATVLDTMAALAALAADGARRDPGAARDYGVDYILGAIARPMPVCEYEKLPWPVQMVVTAFDGAPADLRDLRSRVTTALMGYRDLEPFPRLHRDMERLLRIIEKVPWPERSGLITCTSRRWEQLRWYQVGMPLQSRAEMVTAVIEGWNALIDEICLCSPPASIPTFDVVRFREAFVEIAKVLVADTRVATPAALGNDLLGREPLFRLAVNTAMILSQRETLQIAGWQELPPLVRWAATEYAADVGGRTVATQRAAMHATATQWVATWNGEDETAWITLLSQVLRDDSLPQRLQTMDPSQRTAAIAACRGAMREAFDDRSPEGLMTAATLDTAVARVRAECNRAAPKRQSSGVAWQQRLDELASPVAQKPLPTAPTVATVDPVRVHAGQLVDGLRNSRRPEGVSEALWARRYVGASRILTNLLSWLARNGYQDDAPHYLLINLENLIGTLRTTKDEAGVADAMAKVLEALGEWLRYRGAFTSDAVAAEAAQWCLRVVKVLLDGNDRAPSRPADRETASRFAASVQAHIESLMTMTILARSALRTSGQPPALALSTALTRARAQRAAPHHGRPRHRRGR